MEPVGNPRPASNSKRVGAEEFQIADAVAMLREGTAGARPHVHVLSNVGQHNGEIQVIRWGVHHHHHVHLHPHRGGRKGEVPQDRCTVDLVSTVEIAVHLLIHELIGNHPLPGLPGHDVEWRQPGSAHHPVHCAHRQCRNGWNTCHGRLAAARVGRAD
jgi:hypothetical protein